MAGLGYYTRARNLHTTANEIVEKYGGEFPETYEGLLSLKGVGDYTAAAIASVCFGLPHPVMDGNVTRFITRHFGITGFVDQAAVKKEIMDVLARLMDGIGSLPMSGKQFARSLTPGNFNQSIIEFGALYCVPRNPNCPECVFADSCYALKYAMVEELPLKKQQQPLKPRYFHYLIVQVRGKKGFYFHKRTENDIWKGLYEFPLIETSKPATLERLINTPDWKKFFGMSRFKVRWQSTAKSHLLSHQKITAKFYDLEIEEPSEEFGILVPTEKINELPVPKIIEKQLNREP